ncbi:MAG: putative ABC transporter permease protein [Firmicutes bacterium ADurb.Bin182]|nr:MAG: putative ABC transporter permease protein [Firmicutes bacterium ADurb.Bin182]
MLSVCVGKYPITVDEILNIITGAGRVSDMTRNVFFTLRLPRTVMAMLSGFGLGLAGSVFQMLFKNPLASPDIIGVASGANLGAASAIMLVGGSMAAVAGGAFAGGILAVMLVMLLVRATGTNNTSTYVLSGIIISACAQAAIMILKFFADAENELAAMDFWAMGSFGSVTDAKLTAVMPICLFGIAGIITFRRQIFLLSLDEDEARMLGVRVKLMRAVLLSFSTLAVASVVSVTGLISFIGLIAPHIAKLAAKRNSFSVCVLSGLTGSLVLLFADCLARTLASAELPISILTTFIGVPFLVLFMSRRKEGKRL